MKKPTSLLWTTVALLIIGAGWYLQNMKSQNDDVPAAQSLIDDKQKELNEREVGDSISSPVTTSKADSMLKLARVTDSKFTVLRDARLVVRKYGNDGDSFLVKHAEGKTEFRLYFVDAPESWFNKKYPENSGKRLKQQGDYFGGLSREHTIAVGQTAKKFVKNILVKKPFTVVTQWEDVYGPDRKYCFVIVDYQGEKRYLHEILVAKGLARIHTLPRALPDSTSSSRQRAHLRQMEKEAKAAGVGAWSINK